MRTTKDIEISPGDAWETLALSPSAKLIDVRTDAEWRYVGEPDLKPLGLELVKISWHLSPDLRPNPTFLDELRAAAAQRHDVLLFLCRSGGRSLAAAKAANDAGFSKSFSVAGGFEGDIDELGHRSNKAGWKYQRLPWRQT